MDEQENIKQEGLDNIINSVDELSRRMNDHVHIRSDNTEPLPAGPAIFRGVKVFTSADATPSVQAHGLFDTAGTTTITDFDDGNIGQIVFIRAKSNLTITHNSSIINLSSAANFAMVTEDTLTLAMFADQVWHELARTTVAGTGVEIQTFTSSGTYTKPSGAVRIFVQVWGAGGGGAGAETFNDNNGGGGGGAYVEFMFPAGDVGSTETVTIGAGGAGAVGTAGPGGVGGNSTFGSLATAYGGGGGDDNGAGGPGAGGGGGGALGAGSSASGATFGVGGLPISADQIAGDGGQFGGAAGDAGSLRGDGGFGGGGGTLTNASGGKSVWGGGAGAGGGGNTGGTSVFGGNGGGSNTNATGGAGTQPGGGGGAAKRSSAGPYTGGAGAAGQIIVTTYF